MKKALKYGAAALGGAVVVTGLYAFTAAGGKALTWIQGLTK